MSVPTKRTRRSPFIRSARSSAAVPGAPDAVTTTVRSFTVAYLRLAPAAAAMFPPGAPFFGARLAPRGPQVAACGEEFHTGNLPVSRDPSPGERLRRSPHLDVDEPGRGFGALERFEIRVARGDHVAAPVAVEPHRVD